MGVSLLSNLAAYDFGYIPAGQLIRANGEHIPFDGPARTVSRPFPELVRHTNSATALPEVCLVGRQRKPRRPLADVAARAAGTERPSAGFFAALELVGDDAPGIWKASIRKSSRVAKVLELLRRDMAGQALDAQDFLQELLTAAADVAQGPADADSPDLVRLLRDLEHQCRDHLDELLFVAPWLAHPSRPARTVATRATRAVATSGPASRHAAATERDSHVARQSPASESNCYRSLTPILRRNRQREWRGSAGRTAMVASIASADPTGQPACE